MFVQVRSKRPLEAYGSTLTSGSMIDKYRNHSFIQKIETGLHKTNNIVQRNNNTLK